MRCADAVEPFVWRVDASRRRGHHDTTLVDDRHALFVRYQPASTLTSLTNIRPSNAPLDISSDTNQRAEQRTTISRARITARSATAFACRVD